MTVLLQMREVGCVVGDARVLDRINFTLSSGERIAVVGDNGAGKSILARIAVGLTPPSAGSVTLFDLPLANASAEDMRRVRSRVGVVLQGGSLIGDLSMEDNLRLALGAVRESSKDRTRSRLDWAIITCGLEHATGRLASQLSAGERRRLELARAFLREPELLILDDPFEGADAEAAADLEAVLLKALKRRPIGLLLLTHQAGLGERLGAGILHLRGGRLDAASAAA